MKDWEVWSEGYRATGESGGATFHGIFQGKTFIDACKAFDKSIIGKITWNGLRVNFKEGKGRPSIWGCQLFDNERDARKNFG